MDFTGNQRFQVVRQIGAGGTGVVFEGFDHERRTRIAIKTLRNLDAQALYRLKKEFRSLNDLRHPNVIVLGELVEHSGAWFFTMELVEGQDFLDYVRPHQAEHDYLRRQARSGEVEDLPFADNDASYASYVSGEMPTAAALDGCYDEARLRDVAVQVARGLCAIHAAGKVHRDIKPSNIRISNSGRAVILDFGLVAQVSASRDSTEAQAVGTASYMAPEQAASRPVEPAADWYSFGCTLYEALTGRAPFEGTALKVMLDKNRHLPPSPRVHVPELPADLDELCMALLRIDPRTRPSGSEVLRRLGAEHEATLSVSIPPARSSQGGQGAPFIGRSHELLALEDAFRDAGAGRAVTVLVQGESGLGKTALVRKFADVCAASDSRVLVLAGRCYERESVPYKAFDGVIDALSSYLRRIPKVQAAVLVPRNAALLPRAFPVLGRVSVIAEAPSQPNQVLHPHELRTRIYRALRELLALLAERVPLIAVIDDLQWADAESMALLRELMSPPDEPPLLLLATSRMGAEQLESLGGDVRCIALGPLAPEAARELTTALLERAQTLGADVEAISAEAQGHPLYIDELVRHVELARTAGPRALRLDDAIWQRVCQLGADTARILEVVCVAGAPLPEEIFREASQLSTTEFERHLAVLRISNLVRFGARHTRGRVEPYHDRVREAVVQKLDAADRRAHHQQLANALRGSEMALLRPELLVRHLEGAGQLAESATQAVTAAQRAADALAFDQAAELYRTALALGDHAQEPARALTLALANALANAGRCAEAADVFIALADSSEGVERLEFRRLAAENLLTSGYTERGLNAVREVAAEVGVSMPATPRRALVSMLWHRVRLRLRGLDWTPRNASDVPRATLTRLDVFKAISQGLGLVDNIYGRDFQARSLLLALNTGEPTRIAAALCYESCFLASEGVHRLPHARLLLARAGELAVQHDDSFLRAWGHIGQGFVSYFAGEFPAAVEAHQRAEAVLVDTPTSKWWELDSSRLSRVFSLRHMGSLGEVRRLFDQYLRDAQRRGDRYMEATLKRYCCFLWLAADTPERVEQTLLEGNWMPPEGVFHLQHWFEVEARGDLALYSGNALLAREQLRERFDALESSLLLRVQIVRSIYRWLSARLSLSASSAEVPGRDTERRVGKLIKQLERERVGYASVWAALLRAGVAAGVDRAAALQAFESAERVARESHMLLCATVARRRRGELSGGQEGALLISEADAWMKAQGVLVPERMVEVYAPLLAQRKTHLSLPRAP